MIKENMNHFCRLVLLVGLFALNNTLPAQELRDSKGKDFWIAFAKNYSINATPSLFISSETATSGTVSIPGLGYSINFTTTPGTMTTVVLLTSHNLTVKDGIENKGIHITALEEVTVYGLSRYEATTDAFLCLPNNILGDSYIIPSYTGIDGTSGASQLVVVGTKNATEVTIIPTVAAQSRAAGVPFTIILDQGEAYQLQATNTGDLTGSIVSSNAPVAVFGSVQCAYVPSTCSACDFLAEQIPPISTWGKSFISAPLASRSGDAYRFLASEDTTTINVNGTAVATLNKGNFFEASYSTGLHITSDKAISVIQYSRGQECAGAPGDPFMMLIPPYEQFLGNYTISTSDDGFSSNYINLVVPTRAIGDVRVDGAVVPAASFTAIGTSGFHYAAISISIGTHTINSNYPVGVHVYGFGFYDSYGYPGGQSFSQVAYIDSIMLAPPTSGAQTGTSSCVQATVFDNNTIRVAGVRVDFYVNGVNASSGFAFTDSNGVAEYCYTGPAPGKDSIYAVTGSLTSDTVYKTWTSTATKPVADAGPDQNLSVDVSCSTAVTLDGSGSVSNGGTLTYLWDGPFTGSPLTGVTQSVTLPVGNHNVVLIVTNSASLSDTDTVVVSVVDDLPPAIPTLSTIEAECKITVPVPITTDNCAGTITGTTKDPLTYSKQGTYKITWTFDDGAGNSITQTQSVSVNDATAPGITQPADTSLYISADKTGAIVNIIPPTATDNCSAIPVITARREDGAQLIDTFTQGTTMVWWKACDDKGNCDSAAQKVIVIRNRAPVLKAFKDTTFDEGEQIRIRITANDSDGTTPAITASSLPLGATFVDSGNGAGLLLWNIDCNDHGVYSLTLQASDGIDSVKKQVKITVRDINFAPKFLTINDTSTLENQQFTLLIRTEDCDGDNPLIRAKSFPSGSSFKDNGDGTATFSWLPSCDANGYYMMIFELSDGTYTIRDTSLVQVMDMNCFDPELTLSSVDTTVGTNLQLMIAVHATDRDGTTSLLEARQLPSGAQFTTDGAGSGLLTWVPGTVGTFHPVITAVDAVDNSVRIDTTLTITVTDLNYTGPSFLPCSDTIINENQPLTLNIRAVDPDGTMPDITALTLPDGATLNDNHNGTATVTWVPGCTTYGNHSIIATASDGKYRDTLNVMVVVRSQNCAPVINPIADKNVTAGSTIRFTVSATDPDEDSTIPILSVDCALAGYAILVNGDGSATFIWTATSTPGSYSVSFFASDGFLTDTETVNIAVSQTGTLTITATPERAVIYAMPAASASGMQLGTGNATWSSAPGTYWFRADAQGYRSELFTGTVTANGIDSVKVALKKNIPLMLTPPEAIKVGSGDNNQINGSIAFFDFDGDGIQDLSVARGKLLTVYMGSDKTGGMTYRTPATTIALPADLDSIVAHSYSDWDNDGRYECIITLKNGAIHVAEFNNEELVLGSALLTRSGEKLFAKVTDINRDAQKDLFVYSEQKGLLVYKNIGTDDFAVLDAPEIITDENGAAITGLKSCPMLWDLDGDGWDDPVVTRAGACMQQYMSSGDSILLPLPATEDLNAGGARVDDVTDAALLLLPNRMPKMVMLREGKLYAYAMRLAGDVTGDGVVNIVDISNIAKAWELTSEDSEWNPLFNLKLNQQGNDEVIDVRDISKASKNWEMEE